MSATLPTYSIENVRLSAGFRKDFSTTCWAGAAAQQESPLEQQSPPDELQPAAATRRARRQGRNFTGTSPLIQKADG
jgi:hypothetical protein